MKSDKIQWLRDEMVNLGLAATHLRFSLDLSGGRCLDSGFARRGSEGRSARRCPDSPLYRRRQFSGFLTLGLIDAMALSPRPGRGRSIGCVIRPEAPLSWRWPEQDARSVLKSNSPAQGRVSQITKGKIRVEDLDSETAMALTIFGIWELAEIAYDDILNLSRSLGIALDGKAAGYRVQDREIGINQAVGTRGRVKGAEGYQAPLVRAGSKLRLALPEERHGARLSAPQTDWDRLQGLIAAYRDGDIPVARAYLQTHAAENTERILDLLEVWAAEARDPDLKKQARAALYGLGR